MFKLYLFLIAKVLLRHAKQIANSSTFIAAHKGDFFI